MFRSISHKIQSWIDSKKRLLAIVGLGLLCLHFLIILVYTLPIEFTGSKSKELSQRYALPAFHQQWSLFAPDVEAYNAEIGIRYYKEKSKSWSDWENPINVKGLEDHNLTPKIIRAITHELNMAINSDFGVYYIDGEAQYDKVERTYQYYQAIRYARKYYEWNGINEIDSLQIKMHYDLTSSAFSVIEGKQEKEIILRSISSK